VSILGGHPGAHEHNKLKNKYHSLSCAHRSVGGTSRRGARPLVPGDRALAAVLLAPVLLHTHQEYGRQLVDQRFADLLASAPPSFEGTRFRARLHSCACRPASIWLDTMPTSFPLTLSHSNFTTSWGRCTHPQQRRQPPGG
jgi:hypothetical protein